MNFRQLHTNLPRDLSKALRMYAATHGGTESAVVRAAITDYISGSRDKPSDSRRLDRLTKEIKRLQRDHALSSTALGVFVQMWFAHNPEVPKAHVEAASRSAGVRYKKFLEYVASLFGNGSGFAAEMTGRSDGLDDVTERNAAAAAPSEKEPAR